MAEASVTFDFEKMLPKIWLFEVVKQLATGKKKMVCGTGVCISPAGLVLSSYRVFAGYSTIYARRFQGEFTTNVSVIARKPEWDLVLLKVQSNEEFDYASMEENGDLKEGKDLAWIGHPHRLTFSTAVCSIASHCPPCDYDPRKDEGEFNVYYRSKFDLLGDPSFEDRDEETKASLLGYSEAVTFIQVATRTGPGAWGAPLFNVFGKLVGTILYDGGYAFALHISFVREFLKAQEVEET